MKRQPCEFDYQRGRAAFRRGEPMPKMPRARQPSPRRWFWLGYMLARAQKIMAMERAKQLLTDPDPFDPRPRNAA